MEDDGIKYGIIVTRQTMRGKIVETDVTVRMLQDHIIAIFYSKCERCVAIAWTKTLDLKTQCNMRGRIQCHSWKLKTRDIKDPEFKIHRMYRGSPNKEDKLNARIFKNDTG